EEDRLVQHYHPIILLLWKGNMDIQICTAEGLKHYLCKYIIKSEPIFDAELQRPQSAEQQAFLKTAIGKHLKTRLVGACEIAARLLSYSHAEMSRQVIFLHTEMP